MEAMTGPLKVLKKCMDEKLLVKVKLNLYLFYLGLNYNIIVSNEIFLA